MEDSALRKFKFRSLSSTSSNKSVKQSEETITKLQKENFDLKLKMYYMENNCNNINTEIFKVDDCKFMDLLMENDQLKADLENKQELMKEALLAIEGLEMKYSADQNALLLIIDEQWKQIKNLKMFRKGRIQPRMRQKIRQLKYKNASLIQKYNELTQKVFEKSTRLNELCENPVLPCKIDGLKTKSTQSVIVTENLSEPAKYEYDDALTRENEKMRRDLEQMNAKNQKMERDCKFLQQLVYEQTKTIKALNITIEAKNGEMLDYKMIVNYGDKTIDFDQIIKLDAIESTQLESCLPFHNPLFGNILES